MRRRLRGVRSVALAIHARRRLVCLLDDESQIDGMHRWRGIPDEMLAGLAREMLTLVRVPVVARLHYRFVVRHEVHACARLQHVAVDDLAFRPGVPSCVGVRRGEGGCFRMFASAVKRSSVTEEVDRLGDSYAQDEVSVAELTFTVASQRDLHQLA